MKTMRQVWSIVAALFVCLSASAETVALIDDFSGKASREWMAADKGEFKIEKDALRITYPKYMPGDSAMWPRATCNVESFDFTAYNGFRIDIENPTKEHQFLQLSFRDVGGSQGQLAYRFAPGQRRTITERFDEARPSGNIDWSGVQLFDILRTQPPTDMVWIVRRIELFADRADATIKSQLLALQKKTADALAQAKSGKLMPEAQLKELSGSTEGWAEKLRQPRGVFGKMEQCRAELTAAFGQVKAITLRRQSSTPLLVWTVPMGTAFRPDEALLQYASPAKDLPIYTANGQYEDAIVRLTNLSNAATNVTLKLSTGDDALARALSIRSNQPVKAEDKSMIGDALFPLASTESIELSPYSTSEMWVRVDTKNPKLTAGVHRATLDIVSSEGQPTALPVTIVVRNFDLAKVPQQMKVQAWAEMFAGRSFVVKNHLDVARANLLDYGVNVFNLGPEEIPWPKLNAAGDLASPIDYNLHDERLAFIRGKESPLVLFFMNLDDNNNANWVLQSDLKPGSDGWKRGLKNWLTDWTNHLRKLGLSTNEYALYLSDEPGPEELDRYRVVGKIIREIDPKIQIYINSAELYGESAKDSELMKVTDIWQPDETVGFAADPKLLSTLKSYPNQQLWVYACRTGMRSRSANPHDYYRLMAWRAMRDGLTGIGYWSYCAAMENEDLWDGTKVRGSGAVLVYSDERQIIPSVRWELIRQAVDDTKYVQLLRQLKGQHPSASALLGGRLKEVIEKRDDPSVMARWRIDAGKVIEDAQTKQN